MFPTGFTTADSLKPPLDNGGQEVLPQKTELAPLGNPISVNVQGGEELSKCQGGAERTKSSASVNSLLRPINSQTVEFSTTGAINFLAKIPSLAGLAH
jgi:hypothetical protein